MRIAVVANPSSGRGRGATLIPKADSLLRSMGVEHRMLLCAGPDDPERLAREAAEQGFDVVAALGGDGQVGLCANGIFGTDAALGVIPSGTGNDFARHVGLDPKRPLDAVRLLAEPVPRPIDAVRVRTPERERIYLEVAGAGFDSDVNELANRMRVLSGTPRYVAAVLRTLIGFRPGEFDLRVDEERLRLPAMLVAVGNGPSYGGGMRICPDARVEDGALDLCVIGALSTFEFLRTFPKVFSGRHVEHPQVRVLRGTEVEISSDRTFQVYADGEPVGSTPASFALLPGAVRLVAPPAPARE